MAAKLRLGGAKGILADEIVWEILTWLPTKSLMRFKAVSKLWLSTVLHPKFAREHRFPFRGLLIMNPDPNPSLGWRIPTRDFYRASLDDTINGSESSNDAKDVNVSFQFSIPKDIRTFRASNMVNGVICFYERNVAKLCNIATRETINLPKSRYDYDFCTYHLGFEPIQSVFKLIKIYPISEFNGDNVGYHDSANHFTEGNFNIVSIGCEILTLGIDSSWRNINPPPTSIIPHGLCVDGVLYWMSVIPGLQTYDYPLFSFNLAAEKFRSIPKPFCDGLLNFGSPALVQASTEGTITKTHFVDGCWTGLNKYNTNIVCKEFSVVMVVRGMLPNGNLLLYSHDGVGRRMHSSVYLFHEKTNDIQKFIFRFPASDIELRGRILWYEENIISLKSLTGF